MRTILIVAPLKWSLNFNLYSPMKKILMVIPLFLSLCLIVRADNPIVSHPDEKEKTLFDSAVEIVKRYEGWHTVRDAPYIGYGHRLLPGEQLTANLTEAQADSLLRSDLMKRCAVFRYLSKDSLLVSVLSYNVGIYRLLGYGKIPKSKLIHKLEQGDRDIYEEYISFRMYRGKVIPSLERRRKEEFKLLFKP